MSCCRRSERWRELGSDDVVGEETAGEVDSCEGSDRVNVRVKLEERLFVSELEDGKLRSRSRR